MLVKKNKNWKLINKLKRKIYFLNKMVRKLRNILSKLIKKLSRKK